MLDDLPQPEGDGPTSPDAPEAAKTAPYQHPPWLDARRGRLVGLALALGGCLTVIGVNVYLIHSGPPKAGSAVLPPEGGMDRQVRPLSDPLHDAVQSVEPAPPAVKKAQEPTLDLENPAPDEDRRRKSKRSPTVFQASSRGCSTSVVDGLSRQIIAQGRCNNADAFAPMPRRPNLVTGGHVLYLEAPARDHLVRVLDAHPKRTLSVHSALRTVAQQYLLSRWAGANRCGIQLAAAPGESNHETGLALDVSDPKSWRPALEQEGFQWLGAIDRVHFDFKGPGAVPHEGLDVLAFQQLWNRNHPDDRIGETSRYNTETEARLKKSPAAGFPSEPRCGARPAPAQLSVR